VLTTLDLGVQATVESSIGAAAASLRSLGVTQASVVVLDSRSSEIRALSGSVDFEGIKDGQINGAVLPRQAGSALKPFLYVEALRTGYEIDTLIDDSPAEFRERSQIFAPRNSDGQFLGRITLREALARSRNIPAVRLVQAVSPSRFATVLTEFGLSPLGHDTNWYGLGMALGTAEVRLIELAGAYATLGRGCEQLSPTLLPLAASPRRAADRASCQSVLETLQDEEARVRGFGPVARLGFRQPVAVKTGTSTGGRDLWLFAVTEQYTLGIWAGNFDMAPAHPDTAAMDALAPLAQALLRDLGVQ
jgi:penicillin-binding protein 1C